MKSGTLSKSTREARSESDKAVLASVQPSERKYPGMFPGMYPLVGTPDEIVAEFAKLEAIGVAGSTLVFLNYLKEFPYFAQEVLPRMKRAGLRM